MGDHIKEKNSARDPDCFIKLQKNITKTGLQPQRNKYSNNCPLNTTQKITPHVAINMIQEKAKLLNPGFSIKPSQKFLKISESSSDEINSNTSFFNSSSSFNDSKSMAQNSPSFNFKKTNISVTSTPGEKQKTSTKCIRDSKEQGNASDWRVIGPSKPNSSKVEEFEPHKNIIDKFNKKSNQISFEESENMLKNTFCEDTYDSADILKLVMDMQVKVHKNTAKNSDFNVSHVWYGNHSDYSAHSLSLRDAVVTPVRYSRKVFAGGVPWEATEKNLVDSLQPNKSDRGNLKVENRNIIIEYPNRQQSPFLIRETSSKNHPNYFPGYVYILFETSNCVKKTIENCCFVDENISGKLFFEIGTSSNQNKLYSSDEYESGKFYNSGINVTLNKKRVEFIPFDIRDSEWKNKKFLNESTISRNGNVINSRKTAFIGALHGQMSAFMLASVMSDLFGEVTSVNIDLDKWDYPIGSGRVTFAEEKSLFAALSAGLVEVQTDRFIKKIQIDPFLKSSSCYACHSATKLTYFCRDSACYSYFCKDCWFWRHNAPSGDTSSDHSLRHHVPLTR